MKDTARREGAAEDVDPEAPGCPEAAVTRPTSKWPNVIRSHCRALPRSQLKFYIPAMTD